MYEYEYEYDYEYYPTPWPPRDPLVSLPSSLVSSLPALLSLGTGLGVALHSLLYTWDKAVVARSQVPSLRWTADDQVTT